MCEATSRFFDLPAASMHPAPGHINNDSEHKQLVCICVEQCKETRVSGFRLPFCLLGRSLSVQPDVQALTSMAWQCPLHTTAQPYAQPLSCIIR